MNEKKFEIVQAYVTKPQYKQIKDESKESGISVSALIKLMIIDHYNRTGAI